MKQVFSFKMEEEFEIDLSIFDFEGTETPAQIRKVMLEYYFDQCGFEGIEVKVANKAISVFDQIAEVVQKQNEASLSQL